jgi:hypothetical protein
MSFPKESINYNYFYDDNLFGNKRFLIVEQLSCKKDKELRAELINKKVANAIKKASEKISSTSLRGAANFIVVSSRNADIFQRAIENTTGQTDNL